jgi:2-haloacid dehalogenase
MDLCFTLAAAWITSLSATGPRILWLKIPNMGFPYRAVTFDCFGTLIDWRHGQTRVLQALPSLQSHLEAIPAILDARGGFEIELQTQAWQSYADILSQSIELACQSVCKISLTQKESQAFAAGQMGWPAFADTAQALARLAQRVPVGLLSNCDQRVLEICARKHLAAPISLFVSAERVQSYKPAAPHWLTALEEFGCKAHEILHVSFTRTYDLDPAHRLGFALGFIERYQTPAPHDLPIKVKAPDLAGLVTALGA